MAKNFSKSNLIDAVANKTGFAKTSVQEMVEAMIAEIIIQAANGSTVNVTGLGRFRQQTRKAREGRNPATGATVQIPESQYLAFKPTKPTKA
ncbi:HU family DNA-binding protein [Sinirhodobacter populi]|uniref:HU family DNA-binding protein n=1 Tax=Paenirhodobacter populi TaxID=2306993 RepID=A0A443K7L5_9RHOB|nr:HU family DNA-binding protein [Sinirhodobacter populi]RWR28726.1 HU family DNA-binding protein [Sinirhodobacter populi]